MRNLKALTFILLLASISPAWSNFDDGVAAYARGDYALALQEFRPLAEQGDVNAQLFLGYLYDVGHGVTQDHEQAAKWYLSAAQQGQSQAQYNLGLMYANGRGVVQSFENAAKWFLPAARDGHPGAQFSMGAAYVEGMGVPKDAEKALFWFQSAALKGDAHAQTNLALMYYQGVVVRRNYNQAARWNRFAAAQGIDLAQSNLEIVLAQIEAAKQIYQEGLDAYKKENVSGAFAAWQGIANQGFAIAQNALGTMYAKGEGAPQDDGKAFEWYSLSAQQGFAAAQRNLAVAYAFGRGIHKDTVLAYMLADLAEEKGDEKAARLKDYLFKEMTQEQITEAMVLAVDRRKARETRVSENGPGSIDPEAERIALNERLSEVLVSMVNLGPLEVTEGTVSNPGPPISETCAPDVARKIQEVSEQEFMKVFEPMSRETMFETSTRAINTLNLFEARRVVDSFEKATTLSEEESAVYQETDFGKRVRKLVLPELTQGMKNIGQNFAQLMPGIMKNTEKRLELEGIIKISEDNWCLQE